MIEINEHHIIYLTIEAFFVLVIGFVLWRVMAKVSRRSNQPKGSSFFDSKFKDKWKKK